MREPQYGHSATGSTASSSRGRAPDGRRSDVRRREPAQPQPLAPLRGDPFARPGRVEADRDLDLVRQPERADALGDLLLHDADGRAAHERRQQLDRDAPVVDRDGADDAEVDQVDGRDLGIRGSSPARPRRARSRWSMADSVTTSHLPRRGRRIVNSPWSQTKSSVRRVRPSGSGPASGSWPAIGSSTGRTCGLPLAVERLHRLAAGGRARSSSSSAASGAKTCWASGQSVRSAAARRSRVSGPASARRRSQASA